MKRTARANVEGIRQQSQYTCMAASLCAAMKAWGKPVDEEGVNEIMGASPGRGASWEELLATAQYFGMRATLVVPATVEQLRAWTDQGIPVIIAWNPENRPWSHASVVVEVDAEDNVHVMDPNIPDPSQTFHILPKEEFCRKWMEKVSDSLIVRRPACAITREVSSEGRQVMASAKHIAHEWYVDEDGKGYDDEGNTWKEKQHGPGTYGINDLPQSYPSQPKPFAQNLERMQVMQDLVAKRPNDPFLKSLLSQMGRGRALSENQAKAIRQNLYKNNMKDKADLFRTASGSPLSLRPDYGDPESDNLENRLQKQWEASHKVADRWLQSKLKESKHE